MDAPLAPYIVAGVSAPNLVVPPPELAATVWRWFKQDAEPWLDGLPDLVARLSREWRLEPERCLAGGTASLILAARSAGHAQVVLKVPYPDPGSWFEADALASYGGHGAVALLDFDPTSRAMLIERALPGTPLGALPDLGQAIDIACQILVRLRSAASPPPGLAGCADLLQEWLRLMAAADVHPDASRTRRLTDARELAGRLGEDPAPELLVNRDAHLGNVLRSERAGWLLIDPKPMVGPPAFEGGFLLLDAMNRSGNLDRAMTASLLHRVATGLQVADDLILGWAQMRALENQLWAHSVGEDPTSWESRAVLLARLS